MTMVNTIATQTAARLRSLPAWPWPDDDIALDPIGGGLNNSNWRATLPDGRRYFVKLPGAGTEDYIDQASALEAAVNAAQAGVAPAVRFHDEASGVLVTDFLEGYRPLGPFEATDIDHAIEVVRMYKRLHAGPLLSTTRTYLDDIAAAIDQELAASRVLPAWMATVIEAWRGAAAALAAQGIDLALCHNDPNTTNMMYRPGAPLQMVDYEFASNNDPTFEVSAFLGYYDFPDETRWALIEEYYGRYEFRHEARMRVMTVGILIRFGLWAMAKARLIDDDYDFHKYGTVYFVSASQTIRDPRWPAWVAAVAA